MAVINDPEALRFVNEQVRPLCEAARDLVAKVAAAKVTWDATVAAKFAAGTDTIQDRVPQGVSMLTALEVTQAIGQLAAIAPNTQIISKPCVRQSL